MPLSTNIIVCVFLSLAMYVCLLYCLFLSIPVLVCFASTWVLSISLLVPILINFLLVLSVSTFTCYGLFLYVFLSLVHY